MIKLVSFKGLDRKILRDLESGLADYFSPVEIEPAETSVPFRAYNPIRDQFNSVPFLESINPLVNKGEYVLGVTRKDIYYDNLNFIFGQAQVGGKAGVISVKRLDPKFYGDSKDNGLKNERILKEALHELGHCMGLGHCDDPMCIMVFSTSVLGVDKKSTRFCGKCWDELNSLSRFIAR